MAGFHQLLMHACFGGVCWHRESKHENIQLYLFIQRSAGANGQRIDHQLAVY